MANLSLKLLLYQAVFFNFGAITQCAPLINSVPQEQFAAATTSFRVENRKDSNQFKGNVQIHSKTKGRSRHAALLDINESDLTEAEKEVKRKDELRMLKHYVPQLMGNYADALEREEVEREYVELVQELDGNKRARRFAQAENFEQGNLQSDAESAQPENNAMEFNGGNDDTAKENVTGSDVRKKRQQHRALLNIDVEEKDDEESEAEIAAEISIEKDTQKEPTKSQTQNDPLSEETVHQLYGLKSLVNPLETSAATETQIETVADDTSAESNDDKEHLNSYNSNSQFDREEIQMKHIENSETEGSDENANENENEGLTNPDQIPQENSEQTETIEGEQQETVANIESEGNNENTGGDDGDGFVTEEPNPIPLKENVLTSVLEVEVLEDSFDCSGNRGPLIQMATDSKYFVDTLRLHNFLEARDVCTKYNLVIAEVEELADHRAIESFIKNREYHETKGSSSGSNFFIGLNDIKTEGVFRHANKKNVTYQNFLPSQPDDFNQTEDCVTITKEHRNGPSGAADYDCNNTAHVLCMFRIDTKCYNDSKETIENRQLVAERELHLLVNASERAYFVSNYQLTWKEAMNQCDSKQMKLFNMDDVVNRGFFRSIVRWEHNFFRIPMPTVQYWTSGKFKKSHMTAPIIWHTKPDLTSSEERGIEKHNSTFTFSGLFQWSTKKKVDPGGPHGWRRDLCVSFGLDNIPEETPYFRNTNCDLPAYFICYVEYPDDGKGSGEETTTEEGVTVEPEPIDPEDKPLPPEPENITETEEFEAELNKDGRSLNLTCGTLDEDTVVGRNGIVGDRFRWWDGFTVYIDRSYSKEARKQINAAMYELQQKLCIPFYLFRRNQKPYGHYVHIRDSGPTVCRAEVGKLGKGPQEMSLGTRCLGKGTIMHEMIHALGFWHEQSRPDRDRYVTIHWNNIIQHLKSNFNRFDNTNTFGVPYNPTSIMHYEGYAFSANGRPTITAKNGGPVGSQHVLQRTDIDKLRKMYNCKSNG